VIAVLAAIPSIAWGLAGADYLSDDFWVAHELVANGVLEGAMNLSFEAPARPAVGPYYVLAYQVLGDRPVLHAVLMGSLNALVALLVWRALREVVTSRTALLAALAFAVVPNRGATRLWFVLGPNLVSLACLAGGAFLLLRRGRVGTAVALFVVGILAHEGIAAVAALVIGWWWLQDRRARLRPAAVALAPVAAITTVALLVSPKRGGSSPGPLANLDTLGAGQLGAGFWGSDLLGAIAMVVLVAAATWSIATTVLPSFRGPSTVRREVLIGCALLAAGAAPFALGGAPFAVRGIFDRNNLVPDLGSCLVLAALLAATVRLSRPLGTVVATLVIVVLAAGNVQDVRDYRDAAREGDALVEIVLADVDPSVGRIVVVPPLPGDTGVAQFILDSDLNAALQLRHGPEWASVRMPARTPRCADLVAASAGEPVFLYDRIDRTLIPLPDGEACPDG
jgi:hypothetical protein